MARRKIRPGPLEARSAAILRAIIEEYVATAQPVGSAALVEKYGYDIPVVLINGIKVFKHRVDPREFRRKLRRIIGSQ